MHVHRPTASAALTRQWVQRLDEVLRFKETHGKLPGDGGLEDRERALQQWLKRQKAREDLGRLSPAQIQALNAVDGDWRANQSSLSWENNLTAAILEFQQLGRIPGNDEGAGRWLVRQRSRMSAGKLSDDQISALDEGLPGWRSLDRIRWFQQLEALAAWRAAAGKLPTSRTPDPEGRRLGTWVAFQRRRHRQGLLKDDLVAALDDTVPGWRGRNANAPGQLS